MRKPGLLLRLRLSITASRYSTFRSAGIHRLSLTRCGCVCVSMCVRVHVCAWPRIIVHSACFISRKRSQKVCASVTVCVWCSRIRLVSRPFLHPRLDWIVWTRLTRPHKQKVSNVQGKFLRSSWSSAGVMSRKTWEQQKWWEKLKEFTE